MKLGGTHVSQALRCWMASCPAPQLSLLPRVAPYLWPKVSVAVAWLVCNVLEVQTKATYLSGLETSCLISNSALTVRQFYDRWNGLAESTAVPDISQSRL